MALRSKLCLVIAFLTTLAGACMWDRDTLAEEARGNMDLVYILVGRFERNPPLYFQMRLDRVAKEIEQAPANLDLYDDAGVASDRLGKHTDAITWMEKKALAMKKGKPTKDDRYRFHANLGTFYAHRAGDKKAAEAQSGDLDQAIEHIRKAIEINPKAHFGREKYQLAILEWIKAKPTKGEREAEAGHSPLMSYLYEKDLANAKTFEEAIAGLSGLIRLGNAWESVDVFAALADVLAAKRDSSLAVLAAARVNELLREGKKSIVPDIYKKDFQVQITLDEGLRQYAREEFPRLRKEADEWHQARTEYMEKQMAAGRHPDTDPAFWESFKEKPLEVRDLPFWKKVSHQPGAMAPVLLAVLGIPLCVIVIRALRRAGNKA